MSDGGDLGLGNEDFFGDDDGGDLNRIFDEDDDAPSDPLVKTEPKKDDNEDNHSQSSKTSLDPDAPLDVSEHVDDDDDDDHLQEKDDDDEEGIVGD